MLRVVGLFALFVPIGIYAPELTSILAKQSEQEFLAFVDEIRSRCALGSAIPESPLIQGLARRASNTFGLNPFNTEPADGRFFSPFFALEKKEQKSILTRWFTDSGTLKSVGTILQQTVECKNKKQADTHCLALPTLLDQHNKQFFVLSGDNHQKIIDESVKLAKKNPVHYQQGVVRNLLALFWCRDKLQEGDYSKPQMAKGTQY